jgi:AcrR family transcriptional regulator
MSGDEGAPRRRAATARAAGDGGERANGARGRLPAAERRQQLLDVAISTFSKQGYSNTSMNDIADAAGVTKPVLYQHFHSKRELFLELLRELGGRLRAGLAISALEAGGPRRQVEGGMRAYFRWVADHRGGFEILFSGDSRHDPEFLGEVARVENEIADVVASFIIVEGMDDQRRRLLAMGIVGMAERAGRYWVRRQLDLDADELAAQVAELAWVGLRGLRAS